VSVRLFCICRWDLFSGFSFPLSFYTPLLPFLLSTSQPLSSAHSLPPPLLSSPFALLTTTFYRRFVFHLRTSFLFSSLNSFPLSLFFASSVWKYTHIRKGSTLYCNTFSFPLTLPNIREVSDNFVSKLNKVFVHFEASPATFIDVNANRMRKYTEKRPPYVPTFSRILLSLFPPLQPPLLACQHHLN